MQSTADNTGTSGSAEGAWSGGGQCGRTECLPSAEHWAFVFLRRHNKPPLRHTASHWWCWHSNIQLHGLPVLNALLHNAQLRSGLQMQQMTIDWWGKYGSSPRVEGTNSVLCPFNKGVWIVRGVMPTLKLRSPAVSNQVAEQLWLSPHSEEQEDGTVLPAPCRCCVPSYCICWPSLLQVWGWFQTLIAPVCWWPAGKKKSKYVNDPLQY